VEGLFAKQLARVSITPTDSIYIMIWIYALIGFVLAILGGIAMMTAVVYGTDPHAGRTWGIVALFILPCLGYWFGIIASFLWALGEAFKGG
jgi:hypothetical protein